MPEIEEFFLCIAITFAVLGAITMSLGVLSWMFWKWFNAPYFVSEILFKIGVICLIVGLISSWLLVATLIVKNYVLG